MKYSVFFKEGGRTLTDGLSKKKAIECAKEKSKEGATIVVFDQNDQIVDTFKDGIKLEGSANVI